MEFLICSAIVLCIFFVRDVLVFGSEQSRINEKLALYSAINLGCLVIAMRFWHSLSADQALQLVRQPWIWLVTLAVHAVWWGVVVWVKRRPHANARMWLIAVLPSPMLIVCMVAISHRVASWSGRSDGFVIGVLASSGWIIMILAGVLAFRKNYQVVEGDRDYVATWAEIATWTGIGAVPFTGILQFAELLLKAD